MDGQFVSSVHRVRDLLDLVDAKWLSDRLSDDGTPLHPDTYRHCGSLTPLPGL